MQATAVKPPATADAVPVAMVSLCSWPGSRKCTCMSMKPGQTIRPSGISVTVAPSAGRSTPTRAMRSPSMRMSRTPSIPFAGSMTRPPLSSLFMFRSAGQQVEDRHTHGDAVGDLVENHRVRTIGDLRRDLDAAVHRSWMHDHHVRLGQLRARLGHAEHVEVLAQRGEVGAFHPVSYTHLTLPTSDLV